MAYEMIALDLDGTLMNSEKEITAPVRNALFDIMRNGKKVVLVSGRPTPGVIPSMKQLHLDEYAGYMVSYNGGRIQNCQTGETIRNVTLPKETIQKIYDIAEQFDVDLITYTETHILCNRTPNKYTAYEVFAEKMAYQVVPDFRSLDLQPNKCVFVGDPEQILQIELILKERFDGVFTSFRSEPFFAEVMPLNVDKSQAVRYVLETCGLTREQLICCGDGYNDISMIEYAGLGVAMGNAQPELKKKADYITTSNDDDGVRQVIDRFM